ncbi:hypothetical protein PSAC2689_30355 [Paraburkholderia sacchari]
MWSYASRLTQSLLLFRMAPRGRAESDVDRLSSTDCVEKLSDRELREVFRGPLTLNRHSRAVCRAI